MMPWLISRGFSQSPPANFLFNSDPPPKKKTLFKSGSTPSVIFLFEKFSRFNLEVVNLGSLVAEFLPLRPCWIE